MPPAGQQIESALPGQVDVEQDQIGRELLRRGRREAAVADRAHLESFEDQVVVQHPREHRIVFDHQHALLHGCSAIGSAIATVVPAPTVLRMSSDPP